MAARWNHGRRRLALLLAAVLHPAAESLEYLVNRAANRSGPKILKHISPSLAPETRLVAGERNGVRLTLWQLLPQLFKQAQLGTVLFWLALA